MKPGDMVYVDDLYNGRASPRLGILISYQSERLGTYRKCKVLLSDGSFAWRMMFELREV